MENESQATSPHLHNSGTVPHRTATYLMLPRLCQNPATRFPSEQRHPLPSTPHGVQAGRGRSAVLCPAPVLAPLPPSTFLYFFFSLFFCPTVFQSVTGTKMLLDKGSAG